MKRKGAQLIVDALVREGVKVVAGIPGGSNLPIYHELARSPIRHILARHEQGAGFIAQGMARSTGRAGVCLATSGPGVTNLITAIADAKLDSVPIVAITGQVPTSMIGTDAFQEVDTFGMTMNITKHNYLVKSGADLPYVMTEAFRIAESGRPGPVLIDVPKDIQLADVEFAGWPEISIREPEVAGGEEAIRAIARAIGKAKRPLLYAGGGIIHSGAARALRAFAEKSSIPVVLTLMGLGAFPPDHPLYLGMVGMHGAPYTNYILDEVDLLLAFGARFDDRAVGKVEEFCPRASVIHVDIDGSEIDKIKRSHISLAADIGLTLEVLTPLIEDQTRTGWLEEIRKKKTDHPMPGPTSDDPLNPLNFVTTLAKMAPGDAIIATDVGQHQMWVAQMYRFSRPRSFLTSGGLGTMGFGLPAAIGAALANPDRQIICISGDGSIQMNIQELATLAELDLNVLLFIMNNRHLGLVRQQQEMFYDGNYIASRFESRLNFAAIAREFGIRGVDLRTSGDPLTAIAGVMAAGGPCVIDVPIHYSENVLPIVPPGASNREMVMGGAGGG